MFLNQFEVAETSYGLTRAKQGSKNVWLQLRDEIADNLSSQTFLRHSSKQMFANQREIVALCQISQTLSEGKEFFNNRTWRELENQLLWKITDAEINGH